MKTINWTPERISVGENPDGEEPLRSLVLVDGEQTTVIPLTANDARLIRLALCGYETTAGLDRELGLLQ